MKHLKMFGMVALAALALAAFAASSASAAKVCSTAGAGATCESGHGKVYTGAISATAAAPGAVLTVTALGTTVATITCSTSVAGGTIENGEAGTGKITSMTFSSCSSSNCNEGVTASTNAATAPNWAASVATEGAKSNTNGTMTVSNVTGTFVCKNNGTTSTCKYSATSALAKVEGSDTAPKIIATGIKLTKEEGGFFVCGEAGDWSGTYNITSPTSLFVE